MDVGKAVALLDASRTEWEALSPSELTDVLLLATTELSRRIGLAVDVSAAAEFYQYYAERLPEPDRLEAVQRFSLLCEQAHGLYGPLMPFFLLDPAIRVSSTAALSLACLWGSEPSEHSESLDGPARYLWRQARSPPCVG